jgi:hypothetical protein
MKIFYIILALVAIPLIFFTMYLRTFQGIKQRLGSFFLIRKFNSDYLKVRSLKNILLLFLRLVFAVLIALLIFNPSNVGTPGRNTVFHDTDKKEGNKTDYNFTLNLIAPPQAMDNFDEDRFFLNALIKNYKTKSRNVRIVYNPSEKIIDSLKGDVIIFPHKKQAGNAFLKWVELFDFSSLRIREAKIKDTDIIARACYPILIMNGDKVKKLAELEDGTVIAVSFAYNNGRVLLFGTGASGFWGDMGVSGYFVDIIDAFVNNITIAENSEKNIKKDNDPDFGEVKSLLSFDLILKIASLVFLLELIVFILKTIRLKKSMLLAFVLLISAVMQASSLYAEDFRFIELTMDGQPANTAMFQIIKRELEEKTSVRISPNYYAAHSAYSLAQGLLPEQPYLWIIGCANADGFSEKITRALTDFVERGGIIFVDVNGTDANPTCHQFFQGLALKIAGSPGLTRLSADHPIYKSFYLMNSQNFSGADVSLTTKRSALIFSENNLKQRILNRNEDALKAGVNIVLYMLSGNYKSDQIHTRQILNRLKKRELFR